MARPPVHACLQNPAAVSQALAQATAVAAAEAGPDAASVATAIAQSLANASSATPGHGLAPGAYETTSSSTGGGAAGAPANQQQVAEPAGPARAFSQVSQSVSTSTNTNTIRYGLSCAPLCHTSS